MFAEIILGHLTGDYLFQNKAMALKKSEKGFNGILWCTFHCLVYTTSVCMFLWTINPFIVGLVFLSHWPIDRWSLASKWLDLIGGRNFIAAYHSTEKYHKIDLIFSCFVYAMVDNTMHLIFLWLIVKWLL